MERPETKYARSGDVHVAYQVFGEGDLDVVLVNGLISHVELVCEHEHARRCPEAHGLLRPRPPEGHPRHLAAPGCDRLTV